VEQTNESFQCRLNGSRLTLYLVLVLALWITISWTEASQTHLAMFWVWQSCEHILPVYSADINFCKFRPLIVFFWVVVVWMETLLVDLCRRTWRCSPVCLSCKWTKQNVSTTFRLWHIIQNLHLYFLLFVLACTDHCFAVTCQTII